jgi:hypothetical protein
VTPSYPEELEAARVAIVEADTQLARARQAFSHVAARCPHYPSWLVPDPDADRYCSVCGASA